MRRVEVTWSAGLGRITYKCDSTRIHESGHVLTLFKVRSQDPGYMKILAETKIIPLDRVLEVDEHEW